VEKKSVVGHNALELAYERGSKEMVDLLLQLRPDLLAKSQVPLSYLCKTGDLEGLRKILEEQIRSPLTPKIFPSYTSGCPLHESVVNGRLDVLRFFLEEAKVDANSTDLAYSSVPCFNVLAEGKTAFSDEQSVHVAELLAQHGAKLNVVDVGGRSSLSQCVSSGNVPLMKWLCTTGGLKVREHVGAHSLYYHAFLAKKNKMDMLNLLFELGLDVNVADATGTTLLMQAAQSMSVEVIKWAIGRSATIEARDLAGKTALERFLSSPHGKSSSKAAKEVVALLTVQRL